MDAITLLKKDHHTVEQLFKRFEKAGKRAHVEKRKVVDRIIEELSVHAAIEEQVFYPATRAVVPDVEDVVLESLEEHHVVKWLLSELESMDPADERFDAKVTVLIENVRHHVEEEEDEFFPQVREALGRNALADLGDALADAKRTAPTHPHPRLPDDQPANGPLGLVGAADRLGDNLSGLAQGGVLALQDLIARLSGSDKPKASPRGTTTARGNADKVRRAATAAADGVAATAGAVTDGVSATAKSARAGAKGTATSARRSARTTKSTAKRAATTTGRTAKSSARRTASAANRAGARTKQAATSSR